MYTGQVKKHNDILTSIAIYLVLSVFSCQLFSPNSLIDKKLNQRGRFVCQGQDFRPVWLLPATAQAPFDLLRAVRGAEKEGRQPAGIDRVGGVELDNFMDVLAKKDEMTEDDLRHLHYLLCEFCKRGLGQEIGGKYRTKYTRIHSTEGEDDDIPLQVFDQIQTGKIPGLMERFLQWFNQQYVALNRDIGLDAVMSFASEAHYRLTHLIHPFEDKNGTTARILINVILRKTGYSKHLPLDLETPAYYYAIKAGPKSLAEFFKNSLVDVVVPAAAGANLAGEGEKRERQPFFSPSIKVISIENASVGGEVRTDERYDLLARRCGVSDEAISSFKGKSEKEEILRRIARTNGSLTICFLGHGGEKHIWLDGDNGKTTQSNNMNDPNGISYEELARVLIKRDNLDKVVILIDACYSRGFSTNLRNYLKEKGVGRTPSIIAVAQADAHNSFIDNIDVVHRKHDGVITMQDIFTAAKNARGLQVEIILSQLSDISNIDRVAKSPQDFEQRSANECP